jgi:hypothetical protein
MLLSCGGKTRLLKYLETRHFILARSTPVFSRGFGVEVIVSWFIQHTVVLRLLSGLPISRLRIRFRSWNVPIFTRTYVITHMARVLCRVAFGP